MAKTLLILEDEELLRTELQRHYSQLGWEVVSAADLASARRALVEQELRPLVVLADMSLPDGNALDLFEKLRPQADGGEWVFLTAHGGVRDSVRALRSGAYDFLEKPCELDRLDLVVSSAERSASAQRRLRDQSRTESRRYTPASFLGESEAAEGVRAMLGKLAQVPFSAVVISGETGTGKGIAARILHHSGARAAGPLVEVNCAALPAELMESELFGHEAGAFTGAKGRRRGLVEQASGGTLFLDEVTEIAIGLQAKLLRVIEDRTIRRVGGEREVACDVQIVAATNRDLEKRVEEGLFRADLFHRLSAFRLDPPPCAPARAISTNWFPTSSVNTTPRPTRACTPCPRPCGSSCGPTIGRATCVSYATRWSAASCSLTARLSQASGCS